MSYNSKIYMAQGTSELVITSSGTLTNNGTITNDSSGTITNSGTFTNSTGATFTNSGTITSNGTIAVGSSGAITIAANGYLAAPAARVTTGTTGTTLPSYGMSVLKSTATSKAFTLGTPVAGMRKTLYCESASSTGFISVNMGASGRTFDGTNWVLKFMKADTKVILECLNTGRWIETYRSVADGTALGSTST